MCLVRRAQTTVHPENSYTVQASVSVTGNNVIWVYMFVLSIARDVPYKNCNKLPTVHHTPRQQSLFHTNPKSTLVNELQSSNFYHLSIDPHYLCCIPKFVVKSTTLKFTLYCTQLMYIFNFCKQLVTE